MKNNAVFRPTVVIGLGGTGYHTMLKLKKRFVDAYGSLPPIVRLLSIDTTDNVYEATNTETTTQLGPREVQVLRVDNPAELVNGTSEHIVEWWPPEIPAQSIIAGAGQVRARGRLALFARVQEVYSCISCAIEDVRNIRHQKHIYADEFQVSDRASAEVYIVASLAGGTGSGAFLDVAFMTRNVIGVDEQSNFTAVLLLPGVFARYAGTQHVKPNAYGALKEIEYLSTMRRGFQIDYGMRRVDVNRPPFDLIYLIDNINEQGRVVSEQQDLYGLIADGMFVQIGSQIGADSANAVDNIKTQIATAGLVKGRSPQYCSFGVASLVMPGFEPLMWEDARRLVNDELLNGAVVDAEIEEEVQRFIDTNRLREDNADQVIEALSQREGGGQLRFPMSLQQLKFDNKALTEIKNLHTVHRSRAERQIAQSITKNFEGLRDTSVAAINSWWEAAVNHNNGFTRAERFCEKLQAKLEGYRNMMLGEAKDDRAKLKVLVFKPAEDQIGEAVAAFIKRKGRIKKACEVYGGLVDRETELTVNIARLEKAAELYSSLHARLQSILGACSRIRENFNAAQKQFGKRSLEATNPRGASQLFEEAVAFDPEAQRPKLTGGDFIKWYSDNHATGALLQWAGETPSQLIADVQQFVEERYAPLASLTIDDILRRSSPEAASQQLRRLENLAVPLWRYDVARIPVLNQFNINEFYHYGVADTNTTVLKGSKYRSIVPKGSAHPSIVSTRDERRILLFKVKTGVPLFALADMNDMENAYLDPNNVISNHVDRRWQNIPNVIPSGSEGETLKWFALAQAPGPFSLIRREGASYSMKSRTGGRFDNYIPLAEGRVRAYATFEKKAQLVREAEEVIKAIVAREGVAKVSAILKEYVETLATQVAGATDVAVRDHIENEILAIEDYLRYMENLS